ncbi:hypothetical protein STCU_09205 [Strigomonas culicis]|uniref:Uncharacterized protein n=2 Tax=Strigomonas culicis TaxID=28005 RepID=S9VAE8_9TRYP|nr:hypothetical protein STCU_09205 [Strigomonas culicis]|eukprot:EPY19990.1 hypothetical protein STCU_09205 [Strigomonas culicis]
MFRRNLFPRLLPLCRTISTTDIGTFNYKKDSKGQPNDMILEGEKSFEGPIRFSTGKDNKPGVHSQKVPEAYFEKAFPNKEKELPSKQPEPNEPKDRSDNIKFPQFDTSLGKFETAPYFSGGPGAMRYNKYVREPEDRETVSLRDVVPGVPWDNHHPDLDYGTFTGRSDGNTMLLANTIAVWELKPAIMSLYRSILKSLPMVKHFYWLLIPLPQMKDRIRLRFLQNQHVKDVDAVRHLIFTGWMEFQETVMFRRTRASVEKYFGTENIDDMIRQYTKDEGQQHSDRAFWSGEEQRREGPYDGHWSWLGQESEKEFNRIADRVPKSWTTSKGFFEKGKADGTNFWEKNMDYEGWYIKNVDPDRQNARKELQGWVESGYNQPKHYASKNRRGYRRMVKDIETMMETSMEDLYTHNREQLFQYLIRETHPESNRINAERTLARQDDDFYSTRFDEYEKYLKQAMREMPNPRLWKTDAFYFRLRYLLSPLEYNWAKVPIGLAQEKLFNEWISDTVNYAIYTSDTFRQIKADKRRNPMAKTWADFYADFDPDVPATRLLPWYDKEFNYDRRHKWDERCMRMKRWVQSGTIDGKLPFFDSMVAEWEQYVNRPERFRAGDSAERRYAAPRMVQLYRALNRVMDVALANQLKKTLKGNFSNKSVEEIQKAIEAADLSNFTFSVPTIIYPDGSTQPALGLGGEVVRASA